MANQTSIAIKGIIGIGAMSGISEAQGNSVDAVHYAVYQQRTMLLLPFILTLCCRMSHRPS